MRALIASFLAVLLLLSAARVAKSAEKGVSTNESPEPWAPFVEPDFPFFSSVLDARDLGQRWPANNLTPRGLILNLGNDCWACFDTELLRMSVIWEGKGGVTPISMAQGSYQRPGRKAPEGQEKLPRIIGTPWVANGIYPGWQTGDQISLADPREPGPDRREVGRGPLAESLGRFKALQLTDRGVCLEYEVSGVLVREWIESQIVNGQAQVERRFRLERVRRPLWLVLGQSPNGAKRFRTVLLASQADGKFFLEESEEANGLAKVRIGPCARPVEFAVVVGTNPQLTAIKSATI